MYGKTLGDNLLVVRVYVGEVADVAQDRNRGVFLFRCELRLRKSKSVEVVLIGRKLREIDLQAGVSKFPCPAIVKRVHPLAI